ncbi:MULTISPECIES: phosphotransferase-like protein [Paenibacillus]|uniref:phosphotransferase-like protein n=1 Tax=Paenibacillus TaxID=44249 RepID=UPI002FE0F3E9
MSKPAIYLITGIMASGKSTVAQLLAEQLEHSVHLRGDVFRKMIVNHRVEMTPEAERAEAESQLRLRYRLAAEAADTYANAGFTVVVQDVVVGPLLSDFIAYVHSRPLYVIVLCPDTKVVAKREAERAKKGYGAWTIEALNSVLQQETPRIGLWLDTSRLSPEETVAQIRARANPEALIMT